MKKIIALLFITSFDLIAGMYETPYFSKDNLRTPALRYGWMESSKSARLHVLAGGFTRHYFKKDDIESYVKLIMRNFYKDLKFSTSAWYPMTMELTIDIRKYKKDPSLYYGVMIFSCVPHELARESVFRPYIITTSIIGKGYEIKSLIKKDIDLFIENFAEDTYKIQDVVKERNKRKKSL